MLKIRGVIEWTLIPQNSALLNLMGLGIAVVGFFLTIAGLAIALQQLSQIKTETEATKAAVTAMQFKIASLDVAKECQSGMSHITQIRASLKANDWDAILSSYEGLIETFLKLAHSSGSVSDNDRHAMLKMTEDMAKICEGVRRNSIDPSRGKVLRGQDQALRNFSDVMARLSLMAEKELRA